MGFSSPLFPAMIVKLVLLFICVPCIVVRGKNCDVLVASTWQRCALVANGHAGCPDSFVPCLNDTHCVSIESVCVENTCIESGPNQTCAYDCCTNARIRPSRAHDFRSSLRCKFDRFNRMRHSSPSAEVRVHHIERNL